MTNETAHPPNNKPAPVQAGAAQPGTANSSGGNQRATAGRSRARDVPKRRGGGLLLVILLLIAVAFTILLLSPDRVSQFVASLMGRTPPATISVAPTPGSQPVSPTLGPGAPRPSATPASPPSAAPNGSAVNTELQTIRAMLADITNRLGALERTAADTHTTDLENRLSALDARIAALIEQPAVTPGMLADALTETRQAAQAAAQEAAQAASQDATQASQDAVRTAARDAAQDAVQKAMAAQKDMAPALAELEKRLVALEKMAPAVVAISDIEKRVNGLEKMAPAVVAIADLERRLANLEKTAAPANALSDLDHRLAGVEKSAGPLAAMSQSALQGEALALGLLNLRLALDRGAPYADVLSALRVAATNDAVLSAEVDRLAPNAASGVPTLTTLRQRLSALPVVEAPKPVAAAQQPSAETPAEESGFWAEIRQRLASIVTVRRLDAAQPLAQSPSGSDTMGNAIERAAARLSADDLSGAIALLDSDSVRRDLAAAQQTALDDWLREARARLTAETSFATLSRRSLSLFSARVDGPMTPATAPARAAPSAPATAAPSDSDSAAPGDTSPGP